VLRKRMKAGPIGLDIGASSIKMLQIADEGGKPCVLASMQHDLASPGSGDADPRAAIRDVVAAALRNHPFKGRDVVTAFGCGDFQLKSVRLPRMPPDELASAVEFEAQDRFDFGGKPTQIRHLPVGEVRQSGELREEVVVFVASDERVAARIELLESLKLRPIAIDAAPCAAARSFVRFLRRAEDAASINVFVDIGLRGASIIVTRGAEVSFLKTMEVGGGLFNDAVAKALGVSKEEAADLRVRIMREGAGRRAEDRNSVPEEIKTAAADAVRSHIERLSRDVQMCMRYFAVTFRGQKPESLTIVGGEAHEPTLTTILSDAIDVPCMIGHPMRGIGRLGAIGERDRRTFQPAWAVVCGLALRGSQWVKTVSRVRESAATETAGVLVGSA